MDVQARSRRLSAWHVALGALLLLALLIRLKGVHDPLLDHPGWRQGDTAAIARNFATLDPNPFHPQTDYDGPPPNYVELELQIVPILAGAFYRIFGVHEIFGRLISIAFSLAGVTLLAYFARELGRAPHMRREAETGGNDPPPAPDPPRPFDPAPPFDAAGIAGLAAALAFALYPGAVYYGRTFTPDTAMVTLAIAGVFASYRWIVNDDARFGRGFALAAPLTAFAILAKPVALLILVPIAALLFAQLGPRALRSPAAWTFLVLAVAPYALYDAYLRGIAEWHWASGITTKHVLPELRLAFGSGGAFVHKLGQFRAALGMLWATMLGPAGALVALAALFVPLRPTPRALLWGWLLAALAYAYVVVTVERVDYYLYLFLPAAALWTGMLAGFVALRATTRPGGRAFAATAAAVVVAAAFWTGHVAVRPYYDYSKDLYRRARALDASLPPGALIVMGHYDPSVLYYIGRKGWEEDPLLWTPFDEESAIRKGARAFVSIEDNRLRRNVELCHWLARFPLAAPDALWPVYETDPAKLVPGAEQRWQIFRKLEAAGRAPPCVPPG